MAQQITKKLSLQEKSKKIKTANSNFVKNPYILESELEKVKTRAPKFKIKSKSQALHFLQQFKAAS